MPDSSHTINIVDKVDSDSMHDIMLDALEILRLSVKKLAAKTGNYEATVAGKNACISEIEHYKSIKESDEILAFLLKIENNWNKKLIVARQELIAAQAKLKFATEYYDGTVKKYNETQQR